MTAAAGVADARVPGYLGRVLDENSDPVGTCFQVAPGVLVTAWHVLAAIGAVADGAGVRVDPLAGGEALDAVVARLDSLRDLAVLTCAADLPAVAGPLWATDQVPLRVQVTVTGHAVPDDPGHLYRFLDAPGEWAGGTTRDEAVPLGRLTSQAVVRGMSGAPVICDEDGAVAGVVSGRYNSADGWLAGTVWVARTEDLLSLLEDITSEVTMRGPVVAGPVDVVLRRDIDAILGFAGPIRGREEELRKIQKFATSERKPPRDGAPRDTGYLWYVGRAKAGKTTLFAKAADNLLSAGPQGTIPDVAVVGYFVSCLNAKNYYQCFLDSVISQLAELLPRTEPDVGRNASPDVFSRLWEKAAERLARQERHLLLFVDALDEDGATRRAGTQSIAAQLPKNVPANAHVLVSSRDQFALPRDVPQEHPLAGTGPLPLTEYPGEISSEGAWNNEYQRINPREDSIEKDVLAALAAAGGPLSVEDLSQLLAERHPSQDRLDEKIVTVVQSFGASLRHIDEANMPARYTFAHPSFFEQARNDDHLNLSVQKLWKRVVDWAGEWSCTPDVGGSFPDNTRLWSESTPLYLLQEFPVRLKEKDPQALVSLTEDLGWIVLAIRRAGARSVVPILMAARDIAPENPMVTARLSALRGQVEILDSAEGRSTAFVLRQLCMQAAHIGESVLGEKLSALLRVAGPPEPCLIPAWTTRHAYRALVLRLDARGEIVGSLAAYQEGGEEESIAYGRGYVVGGGGGRVLVWDMEAPSTSPRLLGPRQEPVRAVSVGPDGRVVSGGDDTRLLTWTSPRDDAAPRLFGVHNGKVTVLAWDERGRLLSGGPGGIYRWDSGGNANAVVERTNKRLGRYPGGNVTALVALNEGRVAVGGLHDSVLRIFPDASPAYYDLKRKGAGISALVQAQHGPFAGSMLAGERDGTLCAWSVREHPPAPDIIDKLPAGIVAAAWLSDGRLATGGQDGRIHAWRFGPNGLHPVPRIEIGRHDGPVLAMAALPNGQVVTSGRDGSVCVWDPAGAESPEQPQLESNRYGEAIRSLAWLEEPAAVAVGGQDGILRIRSVDTRGTAPAGAEGSPVRDIDEVSLGRAIVSIAVGSTAVGKFIYPTLVAVLSDGQLRRWIPALQKGQEKRNAEYFGTHPGAVPVFMSQNEVVTGGYDGRVLLWDCCSGNSHYLGRHGGAVTGAVRLGPKTVLTCGVDGRLLKWRTDWARQVRPQKPGKLWEAEDRIHALTVVDNTVYYGGEPAKDARASGVWALPMIAGGTPKQLGTHRGWVTSLAGLGPDLLISAGTDDRVHLWSTAPRTGLQPGHRVTAGHHPPTATIACSAQSVAASRSSSQGTGFAIAHAGTGMTVWTALTGVYPLDVTS